MTITNHRLTDARYVASPNHGGAIMPRVLIVHYTAMLELDGVLAWFAKPESQVSAHLVIGRDGEIVQQVDIDRRAWHAGRSEWRGLTDLNSHSIGVELVNGGKLARDADGVWRTWDGHAVPADEVQLATHRHEDAEAGWHVYPDAQVVALIDLGRLLRQHYPIDAVLGHDDISPDRKIDPGPAFPMARVRHDIMEAS